MSDRICTNCGGQTASGCWLCNPSVHPKPYVDPLDEGYWAKEAGRLAADNIFLRQRITELEAENKALRRTVPHKLWEKHTALLARLEGWLQAFKEGVPYKISLAEIIKEARDENDG